MPPQKRAPVTSDPNNFLVKFSDRDAGAYIVRDIQSADGLCWTFAHPEMKFPVAPQPALRFYMHFWIHERTLHDTGPVTLTVKINGQPLGSVRCEHDGSYLFERPVPMQWLHSGEAVHVLAEATPLWTSPDGGPPLGYLIEEAGFRW